MKLFQTYYYDSKVIIPHSYKVDGETTDVFYFICENGTTSLYGTTYGNYGMIECWKDEYIQKPESDFCKNVIELLFNIDNEWDFKR